MWRAHRQPARARAGGDHRLGVLGGRRAGPRRGDQRTSAGFGTKTLWPLTEAFDRGNVAPDYPDEADRRAGWPTPDGSTRPRSAPTPRPASSGSGLRGRGAPTSPTWQTDGAAVADARAGAGHPRPAATSPAPTTSPSDEPRTSGSPGSWRCRWSTSACRMPSFRGYEGDEQLLGAPRDDDEPPVGAPATRDHCAWSHSRSISRWASGATWTTSCAAMWRSALLARAAAAG